MKVVNDYKGRMNWNYNNGILCLDRKPMHKDKYWLDSNCNESKLQRDESLSLEDQGKETGNDRSNNPMNSRS